MPHWHPPATLPVVHGKCLIGTANSGRRHCGRCVCLIGTALPLGASPRRCCRGHPRRLFNSCDDIGFPTDPHRQPWRGHLPTPSPRPHWPEFLHLGAVGEGESIRLLAVAVAAIATGVTAAAAVSVAVLVLVFRAFSAQQLEQCGLHRSSAGTSSLPLCLGL